MHIPADAVIERWTPIELVFDADTTRSWVDVDVTVIFRSGTIANTVAGFGSGEGTVLVRFAPPETGEWTWDARTPDGATSGRFSCVEGTSRGPVRVAAGGAHFDYADGTPYRPFGTTLYAWTHQDEGVRAQTLHTLAASPFNKVRMCVFPKGMVYNTDDPEFFPFEREGESWNVHRPVAAFWDGLDERLRELDALEVEADLILLHPYDVWGLATLTYEDCLVYLRYCVARLAAHRNVWWSLANEYDMVFGRGNEEWRAFGELISSIDPAAHLLSVHNWLTLWDASLPWVTHCSIQSQAVHDVAEWRTRWGKPVIVDEYGYEGDIVEPWGHLSGFELVHRTWCIVASGGYATHGETYYRDDQVLWWAKGGSLRGEAPMRFAFLRELVEGFRQPLTPRAANAVLNPNGTDDTFLTQLITAFEEADPLVRERVRAELTPYESTAGDDVVLRYLGRSCQAVLDWELPAGEFRIDVIDVWRMTRRTVLPTAAGAVRVPLPAIEGTAVLAVRLP
jgi:hypothetical protein